jgi:hypothetical protein
MKNKILKFLSYTNSFLLLLGITGIDSTGFFYNISLLLIIIPGLWLLLFYIANYEYIERKYGNESM